MSKSNSILLGELKSIIEKIDDVKKEYILLKNKLKEINKKRKEISTDINNKIEQMVDINKEIKEIAKNIKFIKREIADLKIRKRELINKLKDLMKTIKEKPRLHKPYEDLKKELELLELKYETSIMTRKREKFIVDRINHLTIILKKYENFLKAKELKPGLLNELNNVNSELEEKVNKVSSMKKEIDQLSEKLVELRREAAELQKIKRELDKEYEDAYQKIKDVESTLEELIKTRDNLLAPYGISGDNLSYQEVMKIIREHDETIKKAMKKLSKGESLTFEEFTILVKHGLI